MRIAIGQLWQESNTFNDLPTTRADFENFGVFRGAEIVEKMSDTNELGGFIQTLRTWPEQTEIVGLVRLAAWPGGIATADTFSWLRDELLAALRRQMPVDALLLALHGSMVSESVADVEGEILAAMRQIIGPKVPLVATLDLHANITERMVRQADALVLYHTIPHVDVFETGCRGASVLRKILLEGARPHTAFRKLPLVLPVERANTQDSTSRSFHFKRRLQELESQPKILAAGLATVQPWLDIPELGSAAIVVTDGEDELAKAECDQLAAELWHERKAFRSELFLPQDAVREAFQCKEGLVVLGDGADATTSGSPGDSNWILRELLKYDWAKPALVPLVGPDVVKECHQWGAGSKIGMALGGVRDHRFSRPLELSVRIVRFFDASFIMSGHIGKNLHIDMGPSVVLQHENIFVLVTSRSGPHFAPEFFQAGGFDPFAAGVLVAKSPCGFRAAYESRASKIFSVRAPGCAPPDFWNYKYERAPQPLWPWDEMETWQP